MQEIIQGLSEISGFKGSVVFGRDGLVIEQNWADFAEPDFLAADMADLVSLANRISDEKLKSGEFETLTIETESHRIFMYALNSFTYLAVFTQKDARIGMQLWELKDKIKKLQEVV